MTGVAIRRATPEDLDALVWCPALERDRAVIAWALARGRAGAMVPLVAEAAELAAVVGQVWIELARTPGIGVLWALRVRAGWRGRGLGRALIAAGEAEAAAAGAHQAELAVEVGNARARALYERLGYRWIGCEDAVHAMTGAPLGVVHDLLRRRLRGAG